MPKYEVMRETVESSSGRVWPVGTIVDFTPPKIMKRDPEGRPVLDEKGEPTFSDSRVSSNLRPWKDPAAAQAPAKAPAQTPAQAPAK